MPIINIEQDSIDPCEDETGLPNRNTRLQVMATPPVQISIGIEPPTPEERSSNRPTELIIPQLVIEQPSPTRERLPIMYPGSPPPQRQSVGETNFFAPTKQQRRCVSDYVFIKFYAFCALCLIHFTDQDLDIKL